MRLSTRHVSLGGLLLLLALAASPVRGQGGLLSEFFQPLEHTHFSPRGTPYVHPFTMEPPQMHQDVFFNYRYASNTIDGTDENEAEVHVDWALTNRLGIFVGIPFVGVSDNATGVHQQGLSDLEIAPRIVLIDRDTFIASTNFFITIPTGDANRDLGAGETVLAPFITTWHDLGNWNTLLFNFGPQVGAVSGDASFIYGFSLAHSFQGPVLLQGDVEEHEQHEEEYLRHFPTGLTTLYIEMAGETELNGMKRTFIEILPGISYSLAQHAEVRFGVLLPVTRPQRFDAQYNLSFTWIY